MCGILGCINFKFDKASLDSISHRGPDGFGVKEIQANGHRLTLGHRRLSIVDVSENGAQPMTTQDGNSTIVFNGEIYNHEDLKPKLKGLAFKGHSDTETILNLFNEFSVGEEVGLLNGIFGFAIYNEKLKKLFVARDRFGVKPLYYYFDKNQLIFSSEIHPFKFYIPMTYDRVNAIEGMKMRYVGAPATVFKDIRKVEPGEFITFDLGGPEIKMTRTYYTAVDFKAGNRKGEMDALVKEYGQLFERAVDRQLMADVDLGILLSGGIDSALVAAVAKNKSVKPLKTFTVGFAEGLFSSDEIADAKITADTLGLENIATRVEFGDFISDLKQIVKIVEEPIATNSIIPMYSLSRLASQHVKVVLTGQGADEPLYGYRKYKGLVSLEKLLRNKFLQKAFRLFPASAFRKEEINRFYYAAINKRRLASYREYNTVTSAREMRNLMRKGISPEVDTILEQQDNVFETRWKNRIPADSAIVSFPYLDLRTSLSDDLLMYTDKLLMYFGVEGRVPILDNELIDFIESLHHSYKLSFSRGKIIHKKFAEEYLPSIIIHRKKIGFATPASKWYKTYQKQVEDIICSSREVERLFDLGTIREILGNHSKDESHEKQILLLLSFALLLD